jgi:hypothetical protein
MAISPLLALQGFHVLFLALHDWIPLAPLNDVKAVRAANPMSKLLLGTLISTLPFLFGFGASLRFFGQSYPRWLLLYLAISYALLFLGELQAWWLPYLLLPNPTLAARYQVMFGNAHAFLAARNGITPNTLHVILHLATLLTFLTLIFLLTFP